MHKFDPSHIDRLLRQERIDAIKPEQLLREAGVAEGGVFADVGCGPGFFTLPAAAIVGPSGRVYAIDTQAEMLDALKGRGIPANVTLVKSGESKMPVEDRAADLALAAYVLHEASDTAAFLMEILRLLRPGGRLVVIDWKKQEEEHGPPKAERITEDEAAAFITSAGFKGVDVSSLNASHYMITAVRPQD